MERPSGSGINHLTKFWTNASKRGIGTGVREAAGETQHTGMPRHGCLRTAANLANCKTSHW